MANPLAWIVGGGILMTLISLVGVISFIFEEQTLQHLLLPLFDFSAGSLIGGFFFHMIPVSVDKTGSEITVYLLSSSEYIYLLIPFAAGNFLYIGASDLVPEVNRHGNLGTAILHPFCFVAGVTLLYLLRQIF